MAIVSIESLVSHIPDGVSLAIPTSQSGAAMLATRALIDCQVRDLHLIAVPTAGMQADILIGAGCVGVMESAGITMDEQGQAPRFVAAVKDASIALKDTTCPALISALQAGEKGIPFIPMRGLIGSDLLANRTDYQVIDNPMAASGDPIVLLPAIVPDLTLFHAPLADRSGNVWIGKSRELMTMAHAARKTLVTVEEIVAFDLLRDELHGPATIPAHYISAVSIAKDGAWPLPLPTLYDADSGEIARYVAAAQSKRGFQGYLNKTSSITTDTQAASGDVF